MTTSAIFNAFEAAWWFTVASIIAIGRVPQLQRWTQPRTWLIIAFVLFGVSDLIEIRTGAWWRPTSLLILKAICIATIVSSCLALRRPRAKNRKRVVQGPSYGDKPVAKHERNSRDDDN